MSLVKQDILYLQNRIAYVRDEQAYRKIFFHFHRSLFSFANKIVHNSEVAEEVVSDVLMKIWVMENKLAQVDNLRLYLYTAVKNTCFTYLSKNKLNTIPIDSLIEDQTPGIDNTPERQMIFTEIEQEMRIAVEKLSPQCQLVFRLIKEEGFSHKDVCIILGISQNTIETHMRLALKSIKKSLSAYLFFK